jgi:hypothetical protein
VPVLREAAVINAAVAHFALVIHGHDAQLVVVTTAREEAERRLHRDADDTLKTVAALARQGRCAHLHYPDPAGVKADQLNYAARRLAAGGDRPATESFMVCYDVDSRPPLDTLACFENAIAEHPAVSVFHQSSRFGLRSAPRRTGPASWLRHAVADSGALRANRFVLAYEIPRLLNRSGSTSAVKRRLCSFVYTHVTGHGLCVRLSLLERLPFPARSPLEDMHYSFILGTRNEPMLPIASLDRAEVPASVRAQIEQAARWFVGPGRFAQYLRDPAIRPGPRARLLSASALAITVEWLSCAVMPGVLAAIPWATSSGAVRGAAVAFTGVYALQLLAAEAFFGSPAPLAQRIGRLLAFPVACTAFGVAGAVGARRLLRGDAGCGKTERAGT